MIRWMALVYARYLRMSRPGRLLFKALSLTVARGDRVGVLGVNGTGKSTLLRVLVGEAEPEAGVVRRGRGVRVSHLDQEARLPPGATVASAVGRHWKSAALLDRLGMGGIPPDTDVTDLSMGQARRVALAAALVAEADLLLLDEPTNHLDMDTTEWLEAELGRFQGRSCSHHPRPPHAHRGVNPRARTRGAGPGPPPRELRRLSQSLLGPLSR